jgi:hypothetical protein
MSEIIFPKSFPNPTEEEFLLLLLCPDGEFKARWDRWRLSTDFDRIEYATVRLLPLLSMRLRRLAVNDEPAGRIHSVYKVAWFKNQLLIDAAKKVVRTLSAQGIPVILLKGIPLLINAYKDEGARFLGDADILVPEKDATRTIDLMVEHGWTHVYTRSANFRKLGQEVMTKALKETTLRNDKLMEIDVHWKLFDVDPDLVSQSRLQARHDNDKKISAELWTDSAPFRFGGASCRILCPEDLLIHVIVHGSLGNSHRTLRWVTDVIHTIRNSSVNWTKMLEHAKEFQAVFAMQAALAYLHKHFPADVSAETLDLFAKESVSKNEAGLYYKSANHIGRFGLFGNFPLLWSVYRDIKKQGSPDLPGFFEYLQIAWNLPNKRDIPKFIADKYLARISKRTRAK